MKNTFLICLLLLICNTILFAGIPSFDVITIEVDGTNYFIQMESQGKLKNNDLCLYDHDWNYVKDFSEIINKEVLATKQIFAFRSLDAIEMEHLDKSDRFLQAVSPIFYRFSDPIDFTKIKIKNEVMVTSVVKGNYYGGICSKDLKTEDNNWLASYEMEKIFSITNGQICDLNFYAIKGNLNNEEIAQLKTEAMAIRMNKLEFEKLVDRLYKAFIIMVGFCSC